MAGVLTEYVRGSQVIAATFATGRSSHTVDRRSPDVLAVAPDALLGAVLAVAPDAPLWQEVTAIAMSIAVHTAVLRRYIRTPRARRLR